MQKTKLATLTALLLAGHTLHASVLSDRYMYASPARQALDHDFIRPDSLTVFLNQVAAANIANGTIPAAVPTVPPSVPSACPTNPSKPFVGTLPEKRKRPSPPRILRRSDSPVSSNAGSGSQNNQSDNNHNSHTVQPPAPRFDQAAAIRAFLTWLAAANSAQRPAPTPTPTPTPTPWPPLPPGSPRGRASRRTRAALGADGQ